MAKPILNLQSSEATVAHSAAVIYAAYIGAGKVAEGSESLWIQRSFNEALQIANLADETIQSDTELG